MRTPRAAEQRSFPGLRRRLALLCLALTAAALLASASVGTAAAAPAVHIEALAPDYVTPERQLVTWVSVLNTGTEPLSGNLTVKYTLPSGIAFENMEDISSHVFPTCNTVGQVTECSADVSGVASGEEIRFRNLDFVASDATGGLGEIAVSGGGAPNGFITPISMAVEPPGPFAIKALRVDADDGVLMPATQAAAHPAQLATTFNLFAAARTNFDFPGEPNFIVNAPAESFRDTATHVPPGVVGNPTATPARCTAAQLSTPVPSASVPQCPLESQIGLVDVDNGSIVGLYNTVPPEGSPAAFGFFFAGVVTTLRARLRPADNGIDIVTFRTNNAVPLPKIKVTLWGNPSDPAHDRLRGICLQGEQGYNPGYATDPEAGGCPPDTRSTLPFLRNPTSCPQTQLPWGGSAPAPLHWGIEMDSYQHVEQFVAKHTTSPAMEGCEQVPFDPEAALDTSEHSAHSASGLDFSLTVPQSSDPDGLAESDLRAATVTLPQGLSLNPAAADGLGACSDEQLRLGLEGPSQCPDASKLGSLELITPLLEEPLAGEVYLRSQASTDPQSGELYRLALELRSDQRGIDLKLPGRLVVDPVSGQLTTSFSDLPQLPFETLNLHLKNGARAPLTTPAACGTYAAHAVLEGWNGETVNLNPAFTIDQGCAPAAFNPGFEAGVADNTAGHYSPLTLRITRGSGQPNLSRIDTTLPEGELARFAGVALCPEAAMQSGECPAASRIGTLIAGIGEGTAPLYLPQPGRGTPALYVGGPYQGAPYSVLAEVPAQAGPFDLGTVAVRSRVEVDPETTQARIVSEPLPQIYGGIPVSYRDVRIDVDRPSFAINPTGCEPMAVTGVLSSILGDHLAVSDRFQASDCALLGFRPKLNLALSGPVHRRAHPKLIATLKARPGDANIARAQVKLPPAAFLDQGSIGTVCTRPDFAAHSCPAGSVYGRASATSPLLDYPLYGNVYLRSNPAHKLPDLVVDLRGAETTPIEVALAGRTDSVKGALRNTFEVVPDAPVSTFHLELFGGKRGLIELSSGFCAHPNATVKLDAQNGRFYDSTPKVTADCGGRHHPSRGGRYRR
jgi:hypothetical protein